MVDFGNVKAERCTVRRSAFKIAAMSGGRESSTRIQARIAS
jgi:hypothetical protein